jgi:hypothetical protein
MKLCKCKIIFLLPGPCTCCPCYPVTKKGKYWKAIQLGPQGVGRALFANFISVLEIQELNSVFPKGLTSFKFDKLHQDRVSTLLH